ncbi:hypothetical protein MWU59_01720 [Flavobacteriaceae bacterium F08102]|nr:hypothetical protein [Flavobacteriaceae bacterium F08102]
MKITIVSLGLIASLMAFTIETPVNYALFSGTIDNFDAEEVTLVKSNQSFSKQITIDSKGTFTDTIKDTPGYYQLSVGKNHVNIYVNNGNAIKLIADVKDFKRSLKISGNGAETTNYLLFKERQPN